MNAGQLQLFDVVGHVRVNLTRQIDKAPFRVGIDAGCKLIERHFQRVREGFPAVIEGDPASVMQLFRIRPDRFHRHTDRQGATGTVGDQPTRGRDLLHAQGTHVALTHQHIGGNDLQPRHTSQQETQRQ
ncbi:hypothetical protein D3C76_1163780 [compost metagenome]